MPDFRIYHGGLPHWRQQGATYWVAWNLISYVRPLSPDEKNVVQSALNFFETKRYDLIAYVVMDDHIHLIVYPFDGYSLETIIHTWKSFSANQLQRQFGRKEIVWQKDSYDHIIRDEADFREKLNYLMNNPFRCWPEITSYPWLFPQP